MARAEDIKKKVYQKLVSEGFTHEAALGIIANFAYESDGFKAFEEYGTNIHGTKGAGIAMWTDNPYVDRRTQYEAWMKANGKDLNNISDQLDYFIYELKNKPQNLPIGRRMNIKALNSKKTVEEAAEFFMKGFEAPADQSKKHLEKRLRHISSFTVKDMDQIKDPKADPSIIEDVTKQKDNTRTSYKTPENMIKVLSEIDFSKSTLNSEQFDNIEQDMLQKLDNVNYKDNTLVNLAYDNFDKNNLEEIEVDFDDITEADFDDLSAEVNFNDITQKDPNSLAEGGVQPNGRATSFTREEDIKAQKNTYNPLNLFEYGI